MITSNPLIDLSVVLAFGVVFGVICWLADKRNARKNQTV
jgi:hypothetical protein